jgi:hypothetical protein
VKQLIKRSLVQKVGLRKARHYLIKKWNKLTIFAAKSPLSLLIHFTCSSIDHLSLFLLQYFAYRGFSVSRHCTVRHKAVWKGPFFLKKRLPLLWKNNATRTHKRLNWIIFSCKIKLFLFCIKGFNHWWKASKCGSGWVHLPWISCSSSTSSSLKVFTFYFLCWYGGLWSPVWFSSGAQFVATVRLFAVLRQSLLWEEVKAPLHEKY